LPSENSPASGADFPAFEDLKARNGDENPARFLWYCNETLDRTSAALVKGIEDVGRANAWIVAEKRLGDHLDAAPRDRILDQLERRRDLLLVRDGALSAEGFSERHDVAVADVRDAIGADGRSGSSADADDGESAPAVASDGGAGATSPDVDDVEDPDEAPVESVDGPVCPVCQQALVEENVGDAVGLWCSECGSFRGQIKDGEPAVKAPEPNPDPYESGSADEDPEYRRSSGQAGLETWGESA
jgi:hypothetical protein